jgi:hypothetical protein
MWYNSSYNFNDSNMYDPCNVQRPTSRADVVIHDSNMENQPSVMGTETMHYKKTGHDVQCTHNVTVRLVRAITVALGKQSVLRNLSVCICSLRYPACNAHVPYCHLWSATLCIIFPHYLINGTIFKRKLINKKKKKASSIYDSTYA